ncbi:hypothetical protein GCM10025867_42390 [Frondihabitans sucicola]|uniref:Glyoxalase-like domain-containing protein n=1 Tax=Frondihabitans sucicola TaxID=1268041 RepID=A0ABM8GU92_9MICO|nr:VOC family protein [Frondihabitans sucicola]BDZ51998.1 hypothetical protein GCM10025867_42390 [Frondihabitans sucicola]
MTLRWYSIVVDSHDVKAQAAWWAETLSWPIVYDADDEVVISPPFAPELPKPETPAVERWPGFVFVPVPEEKTLKNRLHIDLAPGPDDDQKADVDALLARGATLADVGQGPDVRWVVLRDPEGNEFCVLSPRE